MTDPTDPRPPGTDGGDPTDVADRLRASLASHAASTPTGGGAAGLDALARRVDGEIPAPHDLPIRPDRSWRSVVARAAAVVVALAAIGAAVAIAKRSDQDGVGVGTAAERST